MKIGAFATERKERVAIGLYLIGLLVGVLAAIFLISVFKGVVYLGILLYSNWVYLVFFLGITIIFYFVFVRKRKKEVHHFHDSAGRQV